MVLNNLGLLPFSELVREGALLKSCSTKDVSNQGESKDSHVKLVGSRVMKGP